MKAGRDCLVGASLLLLACRASWAVSVEKPLPKTAQSSSERASTPREREGTQVSDVLGTFKASGDGAMFYYADGSLRLTALPNLNLERVVQAITDTPGEVQWSVSGTLTEFRGANYLLITRAIAQRHAQPKRTAPLLNSQKF